MSRTVVEKRIGAGMGYMRHDAIVVTSWKREAMEEAAANAREMGLEVLGPSGVATNGICTLLVCPDGSKEGWEESDAFDAKRARYLEYLNSVRYEDNSSCLSWVALSYGDYDRGAEITAHTWRDGNPHAWREAVTLCLAAEGRRMREGGR